jgi:hypothetical protein
VIAARQVRAFRARVKPAFDLADTPPVDGGGVTVLFVAGDDTALAADACAHVHMKPVLFAGARRAKRHAAHGQRVDRARTLGAG